VSLFHNVVLPPSAPLSTDDIIAATGRCRCKGTLFFINTLYFAKKIAKKVVKGAKKDGNRSFYV
jgi:hypothetical protein